MKQQYVFQIASHQVDQHNRLKISALQGFLQDAAWHHAIELGVSVDQLQAQGLAWFLSRLTLHVHRLPTWGDTVQEITWPSGRDKLYQYRDFQLQDAQGEALVTAASSWLVVSLTERKVISLPAFLFSLPASPAQGILAKSKIRPTEPPRYRWQGPVHWHDLDQYGHVNNLLYPLWALEALPWDFLNQNAITYLDVLFKQEMNTSGQIVSEAFTHEQGYLHRISRGDDQGVLALLQTKWN
ncbi:MAG: acyl-ACP thioesterase domain-containing protein [Bacteroidota bacterium]